MNGSVEKEIHYLLSTQRIFVSDIAIQAVNGLSDVYHVDFTVNWSRSGGGGSTTDHAHFMTEAFVNLLSHFEYKNTVVDKTDKKTHYICLFYANVHLRRYAAGVELSDALTRFAKLFRNETPAPSFVADFENLDKKLQSWLDEMEKELAQDAVPAPVKPAPRTPSETSEIVAQEPRRGRQSKKANRPDIEDTSVQKSRFQTQE